ncbi:MAG: hypothetical protein J7578_09225 [Chitinophagaceae bacterium]|nr:hypothetical protein [Chitinophagaceae bacterium]
MSISKAIGTIILFYFGCVVLFDLAGVICVTLLPEPGGRRLGGQSGFGSRALYCTVWLVAGIFSGSFFCSLSIGFTKSNPVMQKMPFIILLIALFLSGALILFFYSIGEMLSYRVNTFHDYYVPGHVGMTYTFFITFLLSCLVQLIVSGKET